MVKCISKYSLCNFSDTGCFFNTLECIIISVAIFLYTSSFLSFAVEYCFKTVIGVVIVLGV